MKVAILYICTGKYAVFFDDFYKTCESYFLKNSSKHYYVWTNLADLARGLDNVTVLNKPCMGFPSDSLFRFETFLEVEDKLKQFDFIYFFNANALLLAEVGKEILPDETGLAMGIWPGKRERQHPMFYPYERNKHSHAYVPPYGDDYTYFMGGLNGGTATAYLEMIRALAQNIRDDFNRGIIAKVHDESHINAYLRYHKCKKLGREYCLPEEWITPQDSPKIIFRDKVALDAYFSKGRKFTLWARLAKSFAIVRDALRWYVKF